MYFESLTFVNGESLLMYEPLEIISFYDSHIKKEYKLDVDFKVEGRKVILCPESEIFSFAEDELYPADPIPGHTFPMGDKHILFYEEHFFHDRQYAITYKVKKNTWDGPKPCSARGSIPATMQKLTKGEELNITLLGDSISVGANASGFTDAEPHLPSYSGLLVDELERKYKSKINFHNPSIGGKDSNWGVETVDENVNFRYNDLVIIALGGNDSFTPIDVYLSNISKIINRIRYVHPSTEIIVMSSTYANELLKGSFHGNQPLFIDEMKSLLGPGIALADVTNIQKELLKHKRYIDITGNNVNHPNDFFHRILAQYMIALFN